MNLINELKEHLSELKIQWQLCGGYAIDEYLGKMTRYHKDLDISIGFNDRKICIEYLKEKGWEIDAPVGNGRVVDINYALEKEGLYFDNIWCYKKGSDFIKLKETDGVFRYVEFYRERQERLDFIEVLFNRVEDNLFYYKRNHNIVRDISKAFISKEGINILAPEIILLYKSTNYINKDYQHDYNVVIEKLEKERLDWFLKAMKKAYPEGHPWVSETSLFLKLI